MHNQSCKCHALEADSDVLILAELFAVWIVRMMRFPLSQTCPRDCERPRRISERNVQHGN